MREWIYGRNPVYEVLRARRRQLYRLRVARGVKVRGRLADILHLCSARKIQVERVPRENLDSLASGHQGVALKVNGYPYSTLPDIVDLAAQRTEAPFVLILDTLQDPQNLGTLIRTAESVGVHGVLLPFRRTATVTSAVVSASSGASEHLLIAQANLARSLATLKENGVWVVGLEGSSDANFPDQVRLDGPIALVVGNEGEGMRPLVRDSCDFLMRLPMRGHVDSLNAAVAGSVALYLAWQTRNFSGGTLTRD